MSLLPTTRLPERQLHQFLSEIGVKALRTHLGQILGIARISNSLQEYEQHVNTLFVRPARSVRHAELKSTQSGGVLVVSAHHRPALPATFAATFASAQKESGMAVTLRALEAIPLGRAVLKKVIYKLGGIDAASVQLGVSAALIAKFLDGTLSMPDAVLLRAVDVVLDEQPSIPRGSWPFQWARP